NLEFTVTLDNPVDVDTIVTYSTADGTATTADSDYTGQASQMITILAGDTTGTITIATTADNKVELDETMTVTLTGVAAGGRDVTIDGTANTGTGTITNDDAATISISDATIDEGGNLVFTVTMTNESDAAVSFDYATVVGSAGAGDFTEVASTTLTFAPGETSKTITIATTEDLIVENDETMTVVLSALAPNGRAVTIADDTGEGTITNDDKALLSISDVTQLEGSGGFSTFVFTVSTDKVASKDMTVVVNSAALTAAAGSDFQSVVNQPVTILAGESSATVTVSIDTDAIVEDDETFEMNLTNARFDGATDATRVEIDDAQGIGTILNDDLATITISDPVAVTEGDSGTVTLVYTVTLDNVAQEPITVDFATADGTATAGSDYVTQSGTLTFAAGETTKTISVVVNGDEVVEGNETVLVNLTDPKFDGATDATRVVIGDAQGVGTINDDDAAALTINDVTVTEGNAPGTVNATFTVTLDNAVQSGVNVNFATADGTATTANSDYDAKSGTLNFTGSAGEMKTITVVVNGDETVELDENFLVNLSSLVAVGNVTIADSQGEGTITNDDKAIITISDPVAAVTEGNTGTVGLVYTVTLDKAAQEPITVDFTTADGTANAGSDYVAQSGTLTFAAGVTTQTITVLVNGDVIVEGSETVLVNLSNAEYNGITDTSRVEIGTGTATGTITDDDVAALTINDVTVTEGDGGSQVATFTVTLDVAVQSGVSVEYATADGTATTADSDYVSTSGTLNFVGNAGETKMISVTVNGDQVVELDENFLVNLSNLIAVGNVSIADNQGEGTITNNDAALVSIGNATVAEGGNLEFTVTLDNPVDVDTIVTYSTADGTATTADSDYTGQASQ
ncbi:Calx-beta domain-containing protein, partial [Verrucomicrobiales bacterium BCK34]|nr:Calx-beta domain-containing protein [Verrucomicrobiales bacterium BCK34]